MYKYPSIIFFGVLTPDNIDSPLGLRFFSGWKKKKFKIFSWVEYLTVRWKKCIFGTFRLRQIKIQFYQEKNVWEQGKHDVPNTLFLVKKWRFLGTKVERVFRKLQDYQWRNERRSYFILGGVWCSVHRKSLRDPAVRVQIIYL